MEGGFPGTLKVLLFFSVFLNTAAEAMKVAPVCSVNAVGEVSGASSGASMYSYESEGRQQTVHFSSHSGAMEQNLLHSLYQEMVRLSERGDTTAKDLLADDIQDILNVASAHIARLRASTNQIIQMHEATPFTYVGAEAPESAIKHWSADREMAARLRSELQNKMGSRLNAGQIDDLMLYLMGDEEYLMLPGNPLENLPVLATEDQELFDFYGEKFDECQMTLRFLTRVTSEGPYGEYTQNIASVFRNEHAMSNQQGYQTARDRFIARLVSDNAIPVEDRQRLNEYLSSCDHYFSNSRDLEVAQRMLNTFPEGRGLIFRGTDHAPFLREAFLNECQGRISAATPATGEGGASDGTE